MIALYNLFTVCLKKSVIQVSLYNLKQVEPMFIVFSVHCLGCHGF